MLEEQLAYYLDKYLGPYVKGLSKEALKISVWNGQAFFPLLAAMSFLLSTAQFRSPD